MLRNVKPFDDHQWKQLQEYSARPMTEDEKAKMAKIREGVDEISRMVDF